MKKSKNIQFEAQLCCFRSQKLQIDKYEIQMHTFFHLFRAIVCVYLKKREKECLHMVYIPICDIAATTISGVTVKLPDSYVPYKERYFQWTAFPLISHFKSLEIQCGLLEGWHHTPEFSEIEYHADNELFYFLHGSALMLFCDIADGAPVMGSCQIVRIPAGCELEIAAGKGHFIAVAEDLHFQAIVVSPKQDAPRLSLSTTVAGR